MTRKTYYDRRTVLKIAGASIGGSLAMVGTASADGKPLPREGPDGRMILATWGDDEIWEIFDAEPPQRWRDSEGNDNAHEPLYFIRTLGAEAEHSPHFPNSVIDHVVPVPGGTDKRYSAQWHPKAVVDAENPWMVEPNPPTESGVPNLVNQDGDGKYLTSSTRIENADNVKILEGPEESIFTCPVRPHGNQGHDH